MSKLSTFQPLFFFFFLSKIIIFNKIAFLFAISQAKPGNSEINKCHGSCVSSNFSTPLPFPFGFSPGCPIQLDCSSTGVLIGNFHVLNITSTAIIVDLPAQCDRPLASLSPFFGENYALSAANSLLLQNCSKPLASPCEIRPMFLETSLDLNACLANSDNNISCFAGGDGGRLLSFEEVNKTQCRFLLSSTSIAMDSTRSSAVSLELGRINLDWWVKGDCNCDKTANCTEVKYGNSTTVGFKCLCKEGFEGHGFKEGGGCHRRGSGVGFIWILAMMGYGCGLVLGLSTGYIVFETGRPRWFVRMVQTDLQSNVTRWILRNQGRRNKHNI